MVELSTSSKPQSNLIRYYAVKIKKQNKTKQNKKTNKLGTNLLDNRNKSDPPTFHCAPVVYTSGTDHY